MAIPQTVIDEYRKRGIIINPDGSIIKSSGVMDNGAVDMGGLAPSVAQFDGAQSPIDNPQMPVERGTGFVRSSSGNEYFIGGQTPQDQYEVDYQSNPVDMSMYGLPNFMRRVKGQPGMYADKAGTFYNITREVPLKDRLAQEKAQREAEKHQSDLEYRKAQIESLNRGGTGVAGQPEWKWDAGSGEWVAPPNAQFPMGQRSGSEVKEGSRKSLDYVVGQFFGENQDGPLYTTPQGGAWGIKGQIGKVTNSQEQKRFNNLKEQLSTELRTLFRIPGEGALSDREQAQYGVQLPDVTNDKETNEKILKDIQARVSARLERSNPLQPKSDEAQVQDQGATMTVNGEQVMVLGRNSDGSIRVRTKEGRTGTVRP